MGASTSALQSGSAVPVDTQFRRGKLACRFLMISNCALAVYILTRPRKRERNKVESALVDVPSPAADDEGGATFDVASAGNEVQASPE